MKNIRFYLEHKSAADKRAGKDCGNVFAVSELVGEFVGGFGAITDKPNSPVAYTSAHKNWLRTRCTRISEKTARHIHPALFQRLDEN